VFANELVTYFLKRRSTRSS